MENQTTSAEPALKKLANKKSSTYYRHKRERKAKIKQAKRKYGLLVLGLLIVPSLFIGYNAHQLAIELSGVQIDITSDTARLEAIQAENEELRQENELLATYDEEFAKLGNMGVAIKEAGLEFGEDAEEAVKLQGLMLGIANAESTMGTKFVVEYDKENCHNWWGLKGGNMTSRNDGSSLRCFLSDEAGARTIAKTLKLYYLDEGKDTPEKIVVKYVGSNWGQYHDHWLANVKKYTK